MTHILILYDKSVNKAEIAFYQVILEREFEVSVADDAHGNYLQIAKQHEPDCIFFAGGIRTPIIEDLILLLHHYPVVFYSPDVHPDLEAQIAIQSGLKPFASLRMPMLPQNLYQSVTDVLEG